WLSITDNFLPLARTRDPFQGYLNAALTAMMMACAVVVLVNSVARWKRILLPGRTPVPAVETGD
ncbi:MAG TPA: hypothetical protein VNM72_07285, partial [Blastocatellia bacterium]|nr:hypothetical protein [Blastocatellia bacterium]